MFQLWTEGDEQNFYDLLKNISKQKDRTRRNSLR